MLRLVLPERVRSDIGHAFFLKTGIPLLIYKIKHLVYNIRINKHESWVLKMDRNNLREWRLRKGVTLKQLSQKTGLRYSYLVRLEKGLSKGTPNTWIRLARELQIPIDNLFKETAGEYKITLLNLSDCKFSGGSTVL